MVSAGDRTSTSTNQQALGRQARNVRRETFTQLRELNTDAHYNSARFFNSGSGAINIVGSAVNVKFVVEARRACLEARFSLYHKWRQRPYIMAKELAVAAKSPESERTLLVL
ncbi:hypothetical protein CBL_03185 [Carabus blaptoides fortunei]